MANQKLISFDLIAEFGFFKKPDINDIYLTYNMLHKPALLGILGAIIGLHGYQRNGELPEYYKELNHLKLGIQPLNSDKGNFPKDMIKYNNCVGYANSDAGILNITEQTLIKPSYRCYLLLNIENKNEEILYGYLKNYKAEYLPYMGKNDFSSWWTNFKEYNNVTEFDFKSNYNINSIFSKTEAVSRYIAKSMSIYTQKQKPTWIYFEKLPICFDENLFQYRYGDFVYSNATFNSDMNMSNNGKFYEIENNLIIQLF